MNNFKDLTIWKDAMQLAKEVYMTTKTFPVDEKYGLISQINRCVVSIPSNIAEGCSRDSKKEFNYFLSISLGSSFELETQLMLAESFGYLNKEKLNGLVMTISKNQRMTVRLMNTLK